MNWIRNNKFLVGVAGATLLLVVVAVTLGMSYGGTLKKAMAPRTKVLKKVDRLNRGPKENRKTIKGKRDESSALVAALGDVVGNNTAWNFRNYKVPYLPLTTGSGREVAAFPYSATYWADGGLHYVFVQEYYKRINAMLARLHTVSLDPNALEQELVAEAVRIQRMINLQVRAGKAREAARADRPAEATSSPEADFEDPAARDYIGGHREGDLKADENTGYSKVAFDEAVNNIKFLKATSGHLYADLRSLYTVYAPTDAPGTNEDPSNLWAAMTSLWVQEDVVYAVQQAIKEEFTLRRLPKDAWNVLNSPIKKIVNIQVDGKFPVNESALVKISTPVRDSFRSSLDGEGEPAEAVEKPKTLTGGMTCKEYDLIRYRVTLLMPTRSIPLVYKHLIGRNYHTVLNVRRGTQAKISDGDNEKTVYVPGWGDDEGSGEVRIGATRSSEMVDQMYYFGTESLRLVTFECEVKFLSGWTRGEWDEKTKTWTRPPLAPVEVLQKIQVANPAALRKIDIERLKATPDPKIKYTIRARSSKSRTKPAATKPKANPKP
ncbi:MAG: hypothetical protein HN909_09365 [Phycisphaerales bacterium]|jgi:hypothetical protein|nr:hypothetical protein [Phycisphaerales bacterium]MBT7171958.1 hypothetical protein [Phycisphaerales bacterium]